MKTKGKMNLAHRRPWTLGHVVDGHLQNLKKQGINDRRRERRARRMSEVRRNQDAPVPPKEELKHPVLGLGGNWYSWAAIPGHESEKAWARYGTGVSDQPFIDAFHDHFSGWKEPDGRVRRYNGTLKSDGAFYYGSITLPDWMARTLSGAEHAGEVSGQEVLGLLERVMDRLRAEGLDVRASGGAQHRVPLLGFSIDPQEGALHIHCVFAKSEPLLWKKATGELIPRSQAPGKGRPKAGEGWVGGEPCGVRRVSDGRWDFHEVGPGEVAGDAYREAGFPANPARAGGTHPWSFIEKVVEWRQADMVPGACEPDGTPLLPYDLWASRVFREEVRQFCEARPAVKKRLEAERAVTYRRYCAELGIEPDEEIQKRQELERELEAAKTKAMHAELEAAGADLRVKDLQESVRKERSETERLRAAKTKVVADTTKKLTEYGDYVATEVKRWQEATKKARAERDTAKAQLGVRQAAQVVVRANDQEWTVPQVLEALERMSRGQGDGADELLLNEHGAVDLGVIRQLKAFAELPDIQIAGAAEAALEHHRKFGVRRRTQAAAYKGAGWDPRNIDRAVARENEKHMTQVATMKRLDESLAKALPTEKAKDVISME